jgi:ribosomal protein S18 acetylase RimI-like enzyme
VSTLLGDARKAGYALMRLETLEAMTTARALYQSLGFREVAPWRRPNTDHDKVVFMQLALEPRAQTTPSSVSRIN